MGTFFLLCAQKKPEYRKWERALMVLSHTLSPFGKKREQFFLQAKGTPVQGSPHCFRLIRFIV